MSLLDIPREVYAAISEAYTDEDCAIWWRAKNKNLLGHSPSAAWWSGEGARRLVLDLAQAVADGQSG